jgi:Ca2+-binding EF-hand superfamily protein
MRVPVLFIAAVVLPAAAQAATAAKAPVAAKVPVGFAGSPFEGADIDRDGKVSRAEFIAQRDRYFFKFDRNGDGVINMKDLRDPNNPRARAQLEAFIKASDLNHDGSVSREELKKAATPLFDQVDANHDGYVTPAEADAFRQKQMARRQAKP